MFQNLELRSQRGNSGPALSWKQVSLLATLNLRYLFPIKCHPALPGSLGCLVLISPSKIAVSSALMELMFLSRLLPPNTPKTTKLDISKVLSHYIKNSKHKCQTLFYAKTNDI